MPALKITSASDSNPDPLVFGADVDANRDAAMGFSAYTSGMRRLSKSEAKRETLDLIEPWSAVQEHGIFDCRCDVCRVGYLVWCASETSARYDQAKWDRYNNHAIKDAAWMRGYVTNGDLLACGHSLTEVRGLVEIPCASCGITRNGLMFREYEAGFGCAICHTRPSAT